VRGSLARAALAGTAALALAGCAGTRIDRGVFHSSSGFRVTLPGPDWRIDADESAELALRHREEPAALAANATCEARVTRRPLDLLERHLLLGLRDRRVVERDDVPVNGFAAAHAVVEGRMRESGERVRVEVYVLRGARCVYDLLYVAAPAAFDAERPVFRRFVETFSAE
jgi:hypothetical protein